MNGRLCCPNHHFLRMLKPYETLPDLCSHGLFLMFPWSSTQIICPGDCGNWHFTKASGTSMKLDGRPYNKTYTIELPILVKDLGYLLLTLVTNLGSVENSYIWKVTILLEIHPFLTEPWLWEESGKISFWPLQQKRGGEFLCLAILLVAFLGWLSDQPNEIPTKKGMKFGHLVTLFFSLWVGSILKDLQTHHQWWR